MKFAADINLLPQMLGYIRAEAEKVGIHEEALYKLELASEETIVNIISYAYPGREGKIDITCKPEKDRRFVVTIRDQGKPFNPLEHEITPEVEKPLSERKIGGLGIFLIRQFIDEVSYRREGEENVLTLVVRY